MLKKLINPDLDRARPILDRRDLPEGIIKVYTGEAPPLDYVRVCGFSGGGIYQKRERYLNG